MSARLFGRLVSGWIVALATIQPAASHERRTLDCEAAFPPDASSTSLAAQFGSEHVVKADISVGEGSFEAGSVIYANSAEDRVEILWKDPREQRTPRTVGILGEESHWSTVHGVTLGVDLKTLERINGQPFTLLGFGWDYGGTVVSWSGGLLDAPSRGCKILVRLAPELKYIDPQWSGLYEQVSGDRPFSSNDPVMQQLNPRVYAVMLGY